MATTKRKFGEVLAIFRRHSLLTQGQLAKKVKVTRCQITNMEAGRSWPSVPTLLRLGKALGVNRWQYLCHEEYWRELPSPYDLSEGKKGLRR